jgi:hypothetical protein
MHNNDQNQPTAAPQITLADIEELRNTLGAESDIGDLDAGGTPAAAVSTVMCPSHPWDR